MQQTLGRFYHFIRPSRHCAIARINLDGTSPKHNQNNYKNNNHNDRDGREQPFGNATKVILLASAPPFLAFFKKPEEEEGEMEKSFWEKFLPDDVYLLFRKLPEQDEETPEGKLKTTLKRTILCIQNGEMKKAEQMGHLALRMAQEMQHYDGITFVYDLLGNLAYETDQFNKAEKLFDTVLKRLLEKGVAQDDNRILHLSLKMAQVVESQGDINEANTNYIWTMNKLDDKLKRAPEDDDLHELWGLANNSYGKFLLAHGKFAEAKSRLLNAHDVYVRFRSRNDADFVNILNDLAVACTHTNDLETAEMYIDEAIRSASPFPELYTSGIYHSNKGMILMKKGLLNRAKSLCEYGEKLAKKSQNPDGEAQATYCCEQINEAMKENKV